MQPTHRKLVILHFRRGRGGAVAWVGRTCGILGGVMGGVCLSENWFSRAWFLVVGHFWEWRQRPRCRTERSSDVLHDVLYTTLRLSLLWWLMFWVTRNLGCREAHGRRSRPQLEGDVTGGICGWQWGGRLKELYFWRRLTVGLRSSAHRTVGCALSDSGRMSQPTME